MRPAFAAFSPSIRNRDVNHRLPPLHLSRRQYAPMTSLKSLPFLLIAIAACGSTVDLGGPADGGSGGSTSGSSTATTGSTSGSTTGSGSSGTTTGSSGTTGASGTTTGSSGT